MITWKIGLAIAFLPVILIIVIREWWGRKKAPALLKQVRWERPTEDTLSPLPEEAVRFMWEHNFCPYCGSAIFEGPSGGLSQNVFCGNPDCNSRFNITMAGLVGFPGAGAVAIPAWGEFTGTCPDDFIAWRRAEQLKTAMVGVLAEVEKKLGG
jgi:hypothetical protein